MYKQVVPIIKHNVRNLCRAKYPGHKDGCPNYDKKEWCPPQAPLFDEYYDMEQPIYIIWNKYDLKTHVDKLKSKYPHWSERQLKCCLYWQPTARKQLKKEIVEFIRNNDGYKITTCPEAMGVNITETMKSIGVELEWPPQTVTYQIAMAGKIKNKIL